MCVEIRLVWRSGVFLEAPPDQRYLLGSLYITWEQYKAWIQDVKEEIEV